MNLSNDPAKMEIVSRLVKEGAIDFNEAIKLLEEPQLQFETYPKQTWNPLTPNIVYCSTQLQ